MKDTISCHDITFNDSCIGNQRPTITVNPDTFLIDGLDRANKRPLGANKTGTAQDVCNEWLVWDIRIKSIHINL